MTQQNCVSFGDQKVLMAESKRVLESGWGWEHFSSIWFLAVMLGTVFLPTADISSAPLKFVLPAADGFIWGVTCSKCYLKLNSGWSPAEQQMGMKNMENISNQTLTVRP